MLLCSLTLLFALEIEPILQLNELPAAIGFSGENGVQVVDGHLHLAYIGRLGDEDALVYAWQDGVTGAFQHQILESYPMTQQSLPGAPSLVIDLPEIHIAYCFENSNIIVSSFDGGQNWNNQNPSGRYPQQQLLTNDPYPQMLMGDYGLVRFNTRYDQYGSDYMFFTNNDKSWNDTIMPYMGTDVVYGKVRSNTDIWIKQAGGGTNNGWPTFYGQVITSGVIQSLSGTAPLDQIFLGGLIENADPLYPDPEFTRHEFLMDAFIWGGDYEPGKIILAEVNGGSVSIKRATVNYQNTVTDVYSSYPPAIGDTLFMNQFVVADTVWVPVGSVNLANKVMFKNTLWIRGSFTGNTQIYCTEDIYIIDDIYLQNTVPGQDPGGVPMNDIDKITLISEKQIIIKYGYKDPDSGQRVYPNCGPDTGSMFIYADLIAPWVHPENSRKDGVFTFEYQHPHPSTPAVNIEGEIYDNIDLHRYRYPQTATEPWPADIDYPWYNPLWPERQPYLERGNLTFWGSIYTQRRGFLHRALYDTEHPSNGIWDIEIDYCGATSAVNYTDPILGIQMGAINYPGATGSGVGYKKNLNYDSRTWMTSGRGDVFKLGVRITQQRVYDQNWFLKYYQINELLKQKSIDRFGNDYLFHFNDMLYTMTDEYPQVLPSTWEIKQAKLIAEDLTLQIWQRLEGEQYHTKLVRSNFTQSHGTDLLENYMNNQSASINRFGNGFVFSYITALGNLWFSFRDEDGDQISWQQWDPDVDIFADPQFNSRDCSITVCPAGGDSLFILVWFKATDGMDRRLYLAKGELQTGLLPDNLIPSAQFSISAYPNPFQQALKVSVNSNSSQALNIDVYNVKGQKLRSVTMQAKAGENTFEWDSTDSSGEEVANGIYFLRVSGMNNHLIQKVLKLR